MKMAKPWPALASELNRQLGWGAKWKVGAGRKPDRNCLDFYGFGMRLNSLFLSVYSDAMWLIRLASPPTISPLDAGGYSEPCKRNQCEQSDAERRSIVAIANTFACADEPIT
jgi:hypothetical protein